MPRQARKKSAPKIHHISQPLEDDGYFLAVFRYIVLNPVKTVITYGRVRRVLLV